MPRRPARVATLSLAALVLALVPALTDALGASPPEPRATASTVPPPTAPTAAARCRPSVSAVTAAYRAARRVEAGAVDRLGDHFAGPALLVARRAVGQGDRPPPGIGRLEMSRIDADTVMVTEHRRRPPDRAAVLRCTPGGWRVTEAVTLP